MKRPDLLILVAIWEFVSAFLALVAVAFVGAVAFPVLVGELWGDALIVGVVALGFLLLLLLATVGLGVAAGIGILNGKEWGRILGIIHSVAGLFNVPVGTVAGVLVLVYLTRPEVASYFRGAPPEGASPGT